MNKWELIEDVEKIGIYNLNLFGNEVKSIPTKTAIKLIKQLDEPEKPVVPQFVADWIEVAKTVYSLSGGMTYGGPGVNKWLENEDNQRTFVLAWFDGYEVEEEPKYTVKFKATNQYLCDDDGIGLHISPSFRSNFRKSDLEKLSLTEVFDSPLFEVEEV